MEEAIKKGHVGKEKKSHAFNTKEAGICPLVHRALKGFKPEHDLEGNGDGNGRCTGESQLWKQEERPVRGLVRPKSKQWQRPLQGGNRLSNIEG